MSHAGEWSIPSQLRVVLLMGVSGSGKTTVGKLLARRLAWEFWDADDFHPPRNIRKMAEGQPLNDRDRRPWLLRLRGLVEAILRGEKEPAVLACSALRHSYRAVLLPAGSSSRTAIVFLEGDSNLIQERLRARSGHFMPPQLLDSQFQTLEKPNDAITVGIGPPPERIVDTILSRLR